MSRSGGRFWVGAAVAAGLCAAGPGAATAAGAAPAGFALKDAIAYPFVDGLVSAPRSDRIAWVRIVKGVRNIWVADGPAWRPRQVTAFDRDDGQELTQLTFSPDGSVLVFVRGGDHDGNWPAKGDLAPNPTSSPVEPKVTLWRADPTGARPAAAITEGDAPAVSARNALAYILHGQVWTVGLDGKAPKRLLFDRGVDSSLAWSPDGAALAFASARGDHGFIGVYTAQDQPLVWMAPSTGTDGAPQWSPDGRRLAFVRLPGEGGPPPSILQPPPTPWAIWSADAATGAGHLVWRSGAAPRDSLPDFSGAPTPHWAGNDRLTFVSEADNWPHLYVAPEAGGEARRLTPGAYMVEAATWSRDGRTIVYAANTGDRPDDEDRRHLFKVSVDGGAPVPLTRGEGLEWGAVALSDRVAFVSAGVRNPTAVEVADLATGERRVLAGQATEPSLPVAAFVTPRYVSWTAPDGLVIHGQLFQSPDAGGRQPAVIFVHGGPPRQMLLGWSYMDYYTHAYALNQYLAAHGFTVLAVNYRLGIGYGYDFQHPDKGGWAGSSEYQDVLAAGRYLQTLPGVDGQRIGIWGGSYGGLLTALALARNSDVFKAGVDLHGVHDWSREIGFDESGPPPIRAEKGDLEAALPAAFRASPVADVRSWTSPVLLIHGDDDRNVHFHQTVDLARRLADKGVAVEELVIPDDIHGFLTYAHWLQADTATVAFLTRTLGAR